jgi:hypothetical protein
MRNIFTGLVLYLPMLFALNASADDLGFQVDMSREQLDLAAKKVTLRDIGIGETGSLSDYKMDMCRDSDGVLHIAATVEIETGELSKYGTYLQVEKISADSVAVKVHPRFTESFKDIDARVGLMERASFRCEALDQVRYEQPTWLRVTRVFGASTASGLLAQADPPGDLAAPTEAPIAAATVAPAMAEEVWTISEETDPIDDSPKVVLFNHSASRDSSLIARCSRNRTDLYLITGDFHTSRDDQIQVTTRLDRQPPETKRWGISTDNKALFYPGTPTKFLPMISEAKELVIEVSDETNKIYKFKVDRLAEHLPKLRKACNW